MRNISPLSRDQAYHTLTCSEYFFWRGVGGDIRQTSFVLFFLLSGGGWGGVGAFYWFLKTMADKYYQFQLVAQS